MFIPTVSQSHNRYYHTSYIAEFRISLSLISLSFGLRLSAPRTTAKKNLYGKLNSTEFYRRTIVHSNIFCLSIVSALSVEERQPEENPQFFGCDSLLSTNGT